MKILVFGKNGQVARCLHEEAINAELITLGSAQCNLMTPGNGGEAIKIAEPDIVVNASAYTAVDLAETETDAARRLNADAPAELALAATKIGARFIHISTDYVFDGNADTAYTEESPVAPLNIYGKTKHKGEEAVMAVASDAIIIRTSWVFSEFGGNFVKTMLRLAAERDTLSIVDDQIGGPTPARDIAKAILAIAAKIYRGAPGSGLYHFQGAPAVSWAGFAKKIFEVANVHTAVNPIATAEFPTPAARPLRTILDCTRIERDFGLTQPDWQSGLRQVSDAIGKNQL